ncbi:hypothetical protein HK101_005458 [Irineochytrium annulatum]|nr:hypothetical protein HK101_005458 [Irineochytrium annulatum]
MAVTLFKDLDVASNLVARHSYNPVLLSHVMLDAVRLSVPTEDAQLCSLLHACISARRPVDMSMDMGLYLRSLLLGDTRTSDGDAGRAAALNTLLHPATTKEDDGECDAVLIRSVTPPQLRHLTWIVNESRTSHAPLSAIDALLLFAAALGLPVLLQAVIQHNGDVQVLDGLGLLMAVQGGHLGCVRELMREGAVVGVRDGLAGRIASGNGDRAMVEVLQEGVARLFKSTTAEEIAVVGGEEVRDFAIEE